MIIRRTIVFAVICTVLIANLGALAQPKYTWTDFVQVDGQPEPIPAEWVTTPGGKFAHSLKIPNPVPKDSGYKAGMSSEEYFKHLCETEAGEFIYKTIDNVEGFYFMRPPKRPTDQELKDRYKLEDPYTERLFQAIVPKIEKRATLFIGSAWVTGVSWQPYGFVEEPDPTKPYGQQFLRAHSYEAGSSSRVKVDVVPNIYSRYGLIWRGVIRPHDRELGIAGSEWIIVDLKTSEVLAVNRQYGRTGRIRYAPDKVWWLNAVGCPTKNRPTTLVAVLFQMPQFSAKVIKPTTGEKK